MRDALSLTGNNAVLTKANPLAKFVAVFLISMVLALSIDWVSASIALAAELALFPLAGLTLRLLWVRAWPLIIAAAIGGWSTAIVAADSGAVLLDVGLWSISEGSLELGLGFMLRGLAIALPAILLMTCTDPTDLSHSDVPRPADASSTSPREVSRSKPPRAASSGTSVTSADIRLKVSTASSEASAATSAKSINQAVARRNADMERPPFVRRFDPTG